MIGLMEKTKTMAEFVTALKQFVGIVASVHLEMWLESAEESSSDGCWDEFMGLEISQERITGLADMLAEEMTYEASILESPKLYNHCLENAHAVLKMIHQLANGMGVSIELSEVDRPLTPTEQMAEAGLIDVSDSGMVSLSDVGRQLAEVTEKELAGELEPPKAVVMRIIKVPAGDAPEDIRRHWVGVKLGAVTFNGGKSSLLTGKLVGVGGYMVLADAAIEALEKNSEEAAAWFRKLFTKGSGRHLIFGADEVEIISGG